MILHDYRCDKCGEVVEHYVAQNTDFMPCPCGGSARRIFLMSAKPAWLALAQGSSASPEAIEKFDKMHRQQAAKEYKSLEEHGDYGPRPGSD